MMISRNDPCWCGSGQKWKKCHYPQRENGEKNLAKDYLKRYGIVLKTPEQIHGIRKACELAAYILDETCNMAEAGITTSALNTFAHKLHVDAGAIPAPLGYGHPPFPKSICTSLNEVICHGIPDDVPLKDGDILNIDVSCILNGFYGDCSKMVAIGKVSAERRKVLGVSRECLDAAAKILKPGLMISQIGDAISDVAERQGCSVVDEFVGHGVGLEFHEAPQVPHHRNDLQIPLAAGMTFTIEPMINAGVRKMELDEENQWTAYTKDRKASGQWEHTFLITESGYEILTPWS